MKKAFETLPKEFISGAKVCDYKTPLAKVLSKINTQGAIVVLKGKEYYGIVDSRTIAKKGVLKMKPSFAVGKVAVKVPVLDQDTSIEKAIHHFHNTATKALPYSEGNKIKGIIKREMILRAMLSLHMLSNYKVGDAMSTPVIAIDREASVSQAKSTMENGKVNKIVVVDKGKLFGMLSYRDIISGFAKLDVRSSIEKERAMVNKQSVTNVGEICNTNVYSIDYSRSVDEGIKAMIELKISSLLVTKASRPIGMFTVRDALELAVSTTTAIGERIFISGLDSYTKEYEDDLRSELEGLADKVDRFGRLKTEYISLHINRARARNYEMKGRLSLAKGGTFSSSAFGYSLDDAIRQLVNNLYKEVKMQKEIIVTKKRGDREEYAEE